MGAQIINLPDGKRHINFGVNHLIVGVSVNVDVGVSVGATRYPMNYV